MNCIVLLTLTAFAWGRNSEIVEIILKIILHHHLTIGCDGHASRPGPAYNASCPHTSREQNRRLDIDYKNTIFNNQEYDEIGRFVAVNYIGHNPDEPNGRDALRQAIPTWLEETPKGSFQINRSAVDGDTVWLHIKMPMFGQDYAVVDILRVECGKIVEHWDVVQEMTNVIDNTHPYF